MQITFAPRTRLSAFVCLAKQIYLYGKSTRMPSRGFFYPIDVFQRLESRFRIVAIKAAVVREN